MSHHYHIQSVFPSFLQNKTIYLVQFFFTGRNWIVEWSFYISSSDLIIVIILYLLCSYKCHLKYKVHTWCVMWLMFLFCLLIVILCCYLQVRLWNVVSKKINSSWVRTVLRLLSTFLYIFHWSMAVFLFKGAIGSLLIRLNILNFWAKNDRCLTVWCDWNSLALTKN